LGCLLRAHFYFFFLNHFSLFSSFFIYLLFTSFFILLLFHFFERNVKKLNMTEELGQRLKYGKGMKQTKNKTT